MLFSFAASPVAYAIGNHFFVLRYFVGWQMVRIRTIRFPVHSRNRPLALAQGFIACCIAFCVGCVAHTVLLGFSLPVRPGPPKGFFPLFFFPILNIPQNKTKVKFFSNYL
jgi:hypothetical protein